MRKRLFLIPFLFASAALAVDNPLERWAKAVGGSDKMAALKSIYREATIQYGAYEGTLKVWHTADGKYRKEEQVASYSLVETFDGANGFVRLEGDNTIVLKPEGGVEWRVMLDPQTSLPKTMVHKEGEQTITVTFDSYETVNGINFEKELHRSAGDPSRGAVIRFTKTIINPATDASLFSIAAK